MEQKTKEITEIEKAMKEAYKDYPLVGDYEVNAQIFESNILKIIKLSVEDED